jgi:hypothetical protein
MQAKTRPFANGLFCADFPALRAACCPTSEEKKPMQNHSLVRPTRHANRPSYRPQHLSACLLFIADIRDGTSYAPWKVWSGSTTKETRFVPISKKAAMRIYRKAVQWKGQGKLSVCHGGVIRSHVFAGPPCDDF